MSADDDDTLLLCLTAAFVAFGVLNVVLQLIAGDGWEALAWAVAALNALGWHLARWQIRLRRTDRWAA